MSMNEVPGAREQLLQRAADEYTRRNIGGMQPVLSAGDRVRNAFTAGAEWASALDTGRSPALADDLPACGYCGDHLGLPGCPAHGMSGVGAEVQAALTALNTALSRRFPGAATERALRDAAVLAVCALRRTDSVQNDAKGGVR